MKFGIHIDRAEKRPELPEYNPDLLCSKCNVATETSFGLAGGGFGIYSFCPECGGIVSKSVAEE